VTATDAAPLGLAVAFAGGLLSFLSPCVLPLVPSYLGFVTGMTLPELQTGNGRRQALAHALLFVLGFSLVFVVLGLTATALGRVLNVYQAWLERIGGALVVLFGLWCVGAVRLDFLQREQRVHLETKPVGYLGSALVGMAFGAGWTPCIGPILGGILGLAASEQDLARGALLLGVYSLGLAVPFLVAALAVERFLEWFTRFRRHLGAVRAASGVLLIAVGLLMLSGQFTRLAGWLQAFTPGALRNSL
jgi:cytochrome c-type biogenesis protein